MDVFRGYMNDFFADQATYVTDCFPVSAAVGDFDSDTQLDIVVANFGTNNIGVFLGYGDGSFKNQTIYLLDSPPWFVSIGW